MMLVDLPTAKLDELKATLDNLIDMNAAVFEAETVEEVFTPQVACKLN